MRSFIRLLSGAAAGAFLLTLVSVMAPASLRAAQEIQCAESQNYACCCTIRADGTIGSCQCVPLNYPINIT